MIKKALLVLIIVCLFAFLVGCEKQKKGEYASLVDSQMVIPSPALAEKGRSIIQSFFSKETDLEGLSFEVLFRDYDLRDYLRYESFEALPTAEIIIDGTAYSGTLFSNPPYKTDYSMYNTYPSLSYNTSFGWFCLDPEGNLASLGRTRSLADSTIVLSQNDCLKIAEEFFAAYVPYVDASDYSITVSEQEDSTRETEAFVFTFTKVIDGVDTTDYAVITIRKNGQITLFTTSMMGRVQLNEIPFDVSAVKGTIENKFRDAVGIYESLFDSVGYEILGLQLTVLKDGTPALVVTVLPTLVEIVDGYTWHYSELRSFIVRTVE